MPDRRSSDMGHLRGDAAAGHTGPPAPPLEHRDDRDEQDHRHKHDRTAARVAGSVRQHERGAGDDNPENEPHLEVGRPRGGGPVDQARAPYSSPAACSGVVRKTAISKTVASALNPPIRPARGERHLAPDYSFCTLYGMFVLSAVSDRAPSALRAGLAPYVSVSGCPGRSPPLWMTTDGA